jgi:hypothetical protein
LIEGADDSRQAVARSGFPRTCLQWNPAEGRFDERFGSYRLEWCVELGEQALHDAEVDGTDDISMGGGEFPKVAPGLECGGNRVGAAIWAMRISASRW